MKRTSQFITFILLLIASPAFLQAEKTLPNQQAHIIEQVLKTKQIEQEKKQEREAREKALIKLAEKEPSTLSEAEIIQLKKAKKLSEKKHIDRQKAEARKHYKKNLSSLTSKEKQIFLKYYTINKKDLGTHNPLYALHKEYDSHIWVTGDLLPHEFHVKHGIKYRPMKGHVYTRGTLTREKNHVRFTTKKQSYIIWDYHLLYQLTSLGFHKRIDATLHAYWCDYTYTSPTQTKYNAPVILFANKIKLHHPPGPRSLIHGGVIGRNGWRQPWLPAGNVYRGGEWTYAKQETKVNKRKVVSHALIGKRLPDDKKGGWLQSYERFDDFELTVDVKPDWGCDTGILLRQNMRGEGIQVTIDYRNGGNIGFLHGQGIGSFYTRPFSLKGEADATGNLIKLSAEDHYDAVKQDGLLHACTSSEFLKAWKINDWNTIKVRCTGKDPNITVWVNGLKTIEMKSSQFKARHPRKPEIPVYDPEKVFFHTDGKGHIGLQIHPGKHWKLPDGKVMYRNIMIEEL